MGKQQKIKEERRKIREEMAEQRKKHLKLAFILTFVGVFILLLGLAYWNYFHNNNEGEMEEETTTETSGDKPVATIETDKGTIRFELYPDNAPKTVQNFIDLASSGFYDGTTFHRVVPNFVIQGGDPLSKDDDPGNDGTGDPGYKFDDEINAKSLGLSDEQISTLEGLGYSYRDDLTSVKMEPGVVAMANSGPNTNGSQFFIVINKEQPHLDGRHTVFGKVIEGQEIVEQIEIGDVMNAVTVSQ